MTAADVGREGAEPPPLPPRARRPEVLSLLLALAGVALAAYLTWVHFDPALLVCSVVGGCHTVQSSAYAVAAGVPVALWGLAMYLLLAVLAAARLARPSWRWPLTYAALLLALGGALYSGYLTALELVVIRAVCQWCVASAATVTAIFLCEAVRAARRATGRVEP